MNIDIASIDMVSEVNMVSRPLLPLLLTSGPHSRLMISAMRNLPGGIPSQTTGEPPPHAGLFKRLFHRSLASTSMFEISKVMILVVSVLLAQTENFSGDLKLTDIDGRFVLVSYTDCCLILNGGISNFTKFLI